MILTIWFAGNDRASKRSAAMPASGFMDTRKYPVRHCRCGYAVCHACWMEWMGSSPSRGKQDKDRGRQEKLKPGHRITAKHTRGCLNLTLASKADFDACFPMNAEGEVDCRLRKSRFSDAVSSHCSRCKSGWSRENKNVASV